MSGVLQALPSRGLLGIAGRGIGEDGALQMSLLRGGWKPHLLRQRRIQVPADDLRGLHLTTGGAGRPGRYPRTGPVDLLLLRSNADRAHTGSLGMITASGG